MVSSPHEQFYWAPKMASKETGPSNSTLHKRHLRRQLPRKDLPERLELKSARFIQAIKWGMWDKLLPNMFGPSRFAPLSALSEHHAKPNNSRQFENGSACFVPRSKPHKQACNSRPRGTIIMKQAIYHTPPCVYSKTIATNPNKR